MKPEKGKRLKKFRNAPENKGVKDLVCTRKVQKICELRFIVKHIFVEHVGKVTLAYTR